MNALGFAIGALYPKSYVTPSAIAKAGEERYEEQTRVSEAGAGEVMPSCGQDTRKVPNADYFSKMGKICSGTFGFPLDGVHRGSYPICSGWEFGAPEGWFSAWEHPNASQLEVRFNCAFSFLLDTLLKYAIGIAVIDGKFTTAEAAKKIGIHQITLQKWIAAGKVKAPKPALIGAVGYRLWTRREVANVVEMKKKVYRKGRGRRRRRKNS
jgi:hypothetical protein